jgi:hypothetical protein
MKGSVASVTAAIRGRQMANITHIAGCHALSIQNANGRAR